MNKLCKMLVSFRCPSIFFRLTIVLLCWGVFGCNTAAAQAQNCEFRDSIFHFSFGTEENPQDFSLKTLKRYQRNYSQCPDDGFYAFVDRTSDCFSGDWHTYTEDHTSGDRNGRMMLVNSAENPAVFFTILLNGFKPGKTYEFSCWFSNVCRINSGCPPLPPNIRISMRTNKGKKIGDFTTGRVTQFNSPSWRRYAGYFEMPAQETSLLLTMENMVPGGCGNDFALDDILLRECYPVAPTIDEFSAPATAPIVRAETPGIAKPVEPIERPFSAKPAPDQVLEKKKISAEVVQGAKSVEPKMNSISSAPTSASMPEPLVRRKNELMKKIVSNDDELLIELYDNGTIDGDTVSIYHNNQLVVSKAALSATPIQLKIKVSKNEPMHEIVMVAENLGSIPPNTSLMVVTGYKKRFEVFISSSEQQNAKVIIERTD